MWKRKSPDQLDEEKCKYKKNPKPPLIFAVIVGLISLFYETSLTVFIISFLLTLIIVHISLMLFNDRFFIIFTLFGEPTFQSDNKTVICNICNKIKLADRNKSCQCGGTFELLRKWEWIDDKEI